jgi:hypothetical protein
MLVLGRKVLDISEQRRNGIRIKSRLTDLEDGPEVSTARFRPK